MNVVVLGSGGREHALAWRISRDPQVKSVTVVPGNPGMKLTPAIKISDDLESLKLDLVVVGPEKFLLDGTVDRLQEKGIPTFGPNQSAAFLEGSKRAAKEFMAENKIPTAEFYNVRTEEEAKKTILDHPRWSGYVIKLSGPALGKGVLVCDSQHQALEGIEQFFKHRPAGIEDGIVIEQRLRGGEVSLFFACTGSEFRFVASACDHKRLNDGDEGPNTGGMGAYSPAPIANAPFIRNIEENFVRPTLAGMIKRGTPFSGMLFLGIMLDQGKPFLLEYNVRFGDPETQTFLPLLDGNFTDVLYAVAKKDGGALKSANLRIGAEAAVHVVKAARGYPGLFGQEIEKNKKIKNDIESQSSLWFFSGVGENEAGLFTAGGRVCGITTKGTSVKAAAELAYQGLSQCSFSGEHFRNDIGSKS
jgi:phosphoribosylamine---glycine ligase